MSSRLSGTAQRQLLLLCGHLPFALCAWFHSIICHRLAVVTDKTPLPPAIPSSPYPASTHGPTTTVVVNPESRQPGMVMGERTINRFWPRIRFIRFQKLIPIRWIVWVNFALRFNPPESPYLKQGTCPHDDATRPRRKAPLNTNKVLVRFSPLGFCWWDRWTDGWLVDNWPVI